MWWDKPSAREVQAAGGKSKAISAPRQTQGQSVPGGYYGTISLIVTSQSDYWVSWASSREQASHSPGDLGVASFDSSGDGGTTPTAHVFADPQLCLLRNLLFVK